MTEHDSSVSNWRTSSYTGGGNGSCVEVGTSEAAFAVRDTTNPAGGILWFNQSSWKGFVAAL